MAENSKIEWTDHTFNPWIGCTKVSPACAHCYAEALAKRTGKAKWGDNGTRVVTSAKYWREPHKWNAAAANAGVPAFVFCASMADVFEDWSGSMLIGSGGDQDELRRCPTCGWFGTLPLIVRELAKRTNVEGCPKCDNDVDTLTDVMQSVRQELFTRVIPATPWLTWLLLTKRPENVVKMVPATWLIPDEGGWPDNVWVGTTVENQEAAYKRLPELQRVPARVRFLSCEPLLGPIEFGSFMPDWIIAGGESGPGSRPSHPDWFRGLRNACAEFGTAFFFKQWGDWLPFDHAVSTAQRMACSAATNRCQQTYFGARIVPGPSGLMTGTTPGISPVITHRIGKQKTGRLLDGQLHNDRPPAVKPFNVEA